MSEVWDELYEQRERLRNAVKRISDLEQAREGCSCKLSANCKELALNHGVLVALARQMEGQNRHIKRLEQVIVAMSDDGLLTTYPEAGEVHTHQIYLADAVQEALVEEIKEEGEQQDECNSRGDREGRATGCPEAS